MVGLEGSLKLIEPWDGLEGSLKVIEAQDGLEGSLKVTEPWAGWVGRALLMVIEPHPVRPRTNSTSASFLSSLSRTKGRDPPP